MTNVSQAQRAPMTIRLAAETDLEKIAPLVALLGDELLAFGVPRMDELVLAMIRFGVASGDAVAVAVDQHGEVIGWCARVQLPNLPEGYAEGVGLWVHPAARRERIGTDLRRFADERARHRGARFVSCVVARDNAAGLKSCLAQGYQVVGYQMRKELLP